VCRARASAGKRRDEGRDGDGTSKVHGNLARRTLDGRGDQRITRPGPHRMHAAAGSHGA